MSRALPLRLAARAASATATTTTATATTATTTTTTKTTTTFSQNPPRRFVWMESTKGGRPGQSQDFTPGFYDSTILRYAAHETEYREEVNMRKLLELGKTVWTDPSVVMENARYLQRELPRRLARRLLDLQFLPYIVVINPNIKRVYNSYYNAFQTLRNLEDVRDEEANREFTVLLKRLVDEHGPMVEALAAGLRECKSKPIIGDMLKLDDFLEAMLTSRISRRVLAEQHIALQQKRQNFVGIVDLQLDLREAVDFAFRKAQQVSASPPPPPAPNRIDSAHRIPPTDSSLPPSLVRSFRKRKRKREKQVCVETYGVSPEIRVSGDGDVGDGREIISYVPTHLDYMLFELMKNAMRATVERAITGGAAGAGAGGKRIQGPMPPVSVKICRGDADVTIKIW